MATKKTILILEEGPLARALLRFLPGVVQGLNIKGRSAVLVDTLEDASRFAKEDQGTEFFVLINPRHVGMSSAKSVIDDLNKRFGDRLKGTAIISALGELHEEATQLGVAHLPKPFGRDNFGPTAEAIEQFFKA